jgi:alcohol dehydrogenase (cytochrome c)
VKFNRWAFSLVVLILVGVVGLAMIATGIDTKNGTFRGVESRSITWRVELFLRKAEGAISELSWSELLELAREPGGAHLQQTIDANVSLEGALVNPFVSASDIETGAGLFHQRCATCHGNNAEGWHAPSLLLPGLKHGDSDFSLYHVVRDGVPETSMVPQEISSRERWQIIGFLQSVRSKSAKLKAPQTNYLNVAVSSEDLRKAKGKMDEWLTYSGSLDGNRYSQLPEINPENVGKLRMRWVAQFGALVSKIEATPLVARGRIFLPVSASKIVALDAESGATVWEYDRSMPADLPICCNRVNRGLAILGDALFFTALDGHLVSIDASTGKMNWEAVVAMPSDGYSLTAAPLIANDTVVVGVSGGDYGARGFLAAYDAQTGLEKWRFQTIPGPGEPGHESWKGESWRTGGGATWITGSYDPELDLLYWGVGNPAPAHSGDLREGDNLFTNSVIALHASSGKLAWHFQFTPHDEHDWDSAQTPLLADVSFSGKPQKLICWFNRNGFYYVLDRTNGRFLLGVPFVSQNWAKGLDSGGRPILAREAAVSTEGMLTRPGVHGGTNWEPSALDEKRGLAFVHAVEGTSVFTKSQKAQIQTSKTTLFLGSNGGSEIFDGPFVRAIDISTGARAWEFASPKSDAVGWSGLLATEGGLVFGASAGYLFALSSSTGKECWRVYLGGDTEAPPISFMLDGHQVIAVTAGRALFVFGL